MASRKILITSVGTGVGNAILTAAVKSEHSYNIVGVNTEPFHSGVYRSNKSYIAPNSLIAPDEWIERLLKIIRLEEPGIIMPAKDGDLAVISSHIDKIEKLGTKVLSVDQAIADQCNDKLLSADLFASFGLKYVDTVDGADKKGVNSLIRKYGLPLIVKPRRGTGTIGVKLAQTEQELRARLKGVLEGDYVVQEFLPPVGPLHSVTTMTELVQDHEYSLQIVFGPTSKALGWFASINTLENGLPVAVRTTRSAEVQRCIKAIIGSKQKLVGPFNFQGRLKDGEIIFFEANCRFTGITGTRAGMGFNELDAIWEAFVERKEVRMPEVPAGQNAYRNLEDTYFNALQLDSLVHQGVLTINSLNPSQS